MPINFWPAAALAVALLAGLWPAANETPGRPPAPAGAETHRNLQYGRHGAANTLDLYLPPRAAGPAPVVIWVHGGGWLTGSKDAGYPGGLVGEGYAVASINYRLSGEAKYPAQIEDCKAAVRWLRANARKYNLDPDHFGAFGASAGGHLVALLGTTVGVRELAGDGPDPDVSDAVQAVVDWFGPTDLRRWMGQGDGKLVMAVDGADGIAGRLLGGPVAADSARAERANPIHYVTGGAAPFLIMHGDRDDVVPAAQSRILHDALRKAGVRSTLVILPGAGHGDGGFAAPDATRQVVEFLDRNLKPAARAAR